MNKRPHIFVKNVLYCSSLQFHCGKAEYTQKNSVRPASFNTRIPTNSPQTKKKETHACRCIENQITRRRYGNDGQPIGRCPIFFLLFFRFYFLPAFHSSQNTSPTSTMKVFMFSDVKGSIEYCQEGPFRKVKAHDLRFMSFRARGWVEKEKKKQWTAAVHRPKAGKHTRFPFRSPRPTLGDPDGYF